jgi:hypothetical protein
VAITIPLPTDEIEERAESSLAYLSAHGFEHSDAALERVRKSARVADPLRVFYLGLRSAVGDPSLAEAELVAWRFFVLRGNHAVASTEIAVNAQGGSPRWSHISYDPRIQTHLSVIRRVQVDRRYQDDSYELRFLRVPALDQNALLWLAPTGTGENLLIPMGRQSVLRAGWPYSLAQWFQAVESHAQQRLTSTSVRGPVEES